MGPFLVYLIALILTVGGGFVGLVESEGHPVFLVPILFGLFYFWICWEIVVGPPEVSARVRIAQAAEAEARLPGDPPPGRVRLLRFFRRGRWLGSMSRRR